jgi:hypothetical protein
LGEPCATGSTKRRGTSSFPGRGLRCSRASKENTSYKKNCVSLRTRACQHQAAAPSRAIYLNSSGAALNGARALGGSLLASAKKGAGRGLSQGAPTVANRILSRPKPRGKLAEAVRLRLDQKHPHTCRTCTGYSRVAPIVASLPYWSIERPALASHPVPPGSPGRFC